MIDWTALYRLTVVLLAVSYAVQFLLFLTLHPRGRLEWATTLASLTIFIFFGTLAVWLNVLLGGVRPVVYPPLVIASVIAMLGSIAFTTASLDAWHDRRC